MFKTHTTQNTQHNTTHISSHFSAALAENLPHPLPAAAAPVTAGRKHGEGLLVEPSGRFYRGQWRDGKRPSPSGKAGEPVAGPGLGKFDLVAFWVSQVVDRQSQQD